MSAEQQKHPQHGAVKYQETEAHARRGYEVLDAPAGATYRAGLYILGMMFLVALLVVPFYWLLARGESRDQPLPKTVVRSAPQAAATYPRLVTSEPAVLQDFRRQEDTVLDTYAWVEKDRGIARIPVAEAIRIVGSRGRLPSFPTAAFAAPPSAAAGAQATPGGAR